MPASKIPRQGIRSSQREGGSCRPGATRTADQELLQLSPDRRTAEMREFQKEGQQAVWTREKKVMWVGNWCLLNPEGKGTAGPAHYSAITKGNFESDRVRP